MAGRYYLAHGEDGEVYAVPVERRDDFKAWIYSADWENGIAPDYVVDATDYRRFTFTDPRCE